MCYVSYLEFRDKPRTSSSLINAYSVSFWTVCCRIETNGSYSFCSVGIGPLDSSRPYLSCNDCSWRSHCSLTIWKYFYCCLCWFLLSQASCSFVKSTLCCLKYFGHVTQDDEVRITWTWPKYPGYDSFRDNTKPTDISSVDLLVSLAWISCCRRRGMLAMHG